MTAIGFLIAAIVLFVGFYAWYWYVNRDGVYNAAAGDEDTTYRMRGIDRLRTTRSSLTAETGIIGEREEPEAAEEIERGEGIDAFPVTADRTASIDDQTASAEPQAHRAARQALLQTSPRATANRETTMRFDEIHFVDATPATGGISDTAQSRIAETVARTRNNYMEETGTIGDVNLDDGRATNDTTVEADGDMTMQNPLDPMFGGENRQQREKH
jgi:hypothetical protein